MPATQSELDELVLANTGLVKKIANKLAFVICQGNRVEQEELFGELCSAGYEGLIKACKRFDPSTGNRISSLAVPWIRGEILHYLRDRGLTPRVPRKWRDLYMRGHKLPDVEAAERCEVSLEEWQEIKQACSVYMAEFEQKHDREWLPSQEPEERSHLTQALEQIETWIEGLPDDQSEAVRLYFFEGRSGRKVKGKVTEAIATIQ